MTRSQLENEPKKNIMQYQLSVILPARNEMFLSRTIQDIIENKEAETEIIAVLDGEWANPEIPQHPNVNVIYVPESIGQRAATNLGVKLSKAQYIMKADSHCSFDKGFDRKMIEFMEEHGDITSVPIMRNLWAFDWKCMKCGKKWYQGPTPTKCQEDNFRGTGKPCDSTKFKRKMMWVGKKNPQSWTYCFDTEPHFQYFNEYKRRPGVRQKARETGFSETMSLQGSCWMMSKEKYSEFAKDREELGSWGNEGLEIACKEWLSGGKVLVNHKTWYAHMFRTQGGDFGFPYHQGGRDVSRTKQKVWESIKNKKLPNQIYPVSWLIKKFSPVPKWNDEDVKNLEEYERNS